MRQPQPTTKILGGVQKAFLKRPSAPHRAPLPSIHGDPLLPLPYLPGAPPLALRELDLSHPLRSLYTQESLHTRAPVAPPAASREHRRTRARAVPHPTHNRVSKMLPTKATRTTQTTTRKRPSTYRYPYPYM